MKIFLIIVFLIVASNLLAQSQKAELIFNDGTLIEGFASIYKNDKIKFRINLEDEADIWTAEMVKNIIFYGFEMKLKFEYVKLKANKSPKLLEVLAEGPVNLYADVNDIIYYTSNYGTNYGTNANYNTNSTKHEIKTIKLYIRRDEIFPIPLNGNFTRKSKSYFSDCIGVIRRLNTGEFRKSNAPEMVNYYNDYCTE